MEKMQLFELAEDLHPGHKANGLVALGWRKNLREVQQEGRSLRICWPARGSGIPRLLLPLC